MPGEEGAHTVLQKTCIFIVLKIGCDKLPGHLNGEDQGAAIQSAYLMEVPVSYTHLDVYKRQSLYRVMIREA